MREELSMARTQEWTCLRQIQWSINQEYKQCWMPRVKPGYPVKRRKSLGTEVSSAKNLQKEVLDSISKTMAGMEVKSGDPKRMKSEERRRDAVLGVVVKAELSASANRADEQPKVTVGFIVKNKTDREMLQPVIHSLTKENDVPMRSAEGGQLRESRSGELVL
ncbi:hypothetical protein R1flu_017649 [Riccia fluitans]|uniref:Transposase n=1 Tax=Riccia fluitans TaxID=41844 RepID=A0ABD1ZFY0_9MARC